MNPDGLPEVSPSRVRYSLRFVVPGMCYAASNNLYLFALTMVAPPIWTILTSLRTPITTLAYKVDSHNYSMVARWQNLIPSFPWIAPG